jgi:hypothetical protein
MALELEQRQDGGVHVCMEENGLRACCFVSSHHLASSKEAQLRAAINRAALQAFEATPPAL